MRRFLIPLVAVAGLFPAAALAQDVVWDEPDAPAARGSWAFAIGAGTDSRSKGLSKTDGEPFGYALAEWSDPSGIYYVSGGVENIDHSTGADLEVELTAGARPQFAGFDLDLNVAHKWLLDAAPGADDDQWEFTANAARALGPASARLQLQYSPDGAGATEAWTWVEGRLGWEFSPTVGATAAVGRREQDNSVDYTAWNAGLTWAFHRDADLDLRWHDNSESHRGGQYDSALVATVNVFF